MTLSRPFTLAGSRTRAHLHLLSSTVSKTHAALIHDNGRVYVRDLASRTRVYVNGRAIREVQLNDGDLLQIGSFTFKLAHPSAAESVPLPRPGQLDMAGSAESLQLDGKTTTIGRRGACDLAIDDPAVSTVHAIIFELDGQRFIRDLGSRTGTFVNNTAIHQQPLNFGDRIRIGPAEYKYRKSKRVDEQSAVGPELAPADLVADSDADQIADMAELEDLVGTARLSQDEEQAFALPPKKPAAAKRPVAEPGVPPVKAPPVPPVELEVAATADDDSAAIPLASDEIPLADWSDLGLQTPATEEAAEAEQPAEDEASGDGVWTEAPETEAAEDESPPAAEMPADRVSSNYAPIDPEQTDHSPIELAPIETSAEEFVADAADGGQEMDFDWATAPTPAETESVAEKAEPIAPPQQPVPPEAIETVEAGPAQTDLDDFLLDLPEAEPAEIDVASDSAPTEQAVAESLAEPAGDLAESADVGTEVDDAFFAELDHAPPTAPEGSEHAPEQTDAEANAGTDTAGAPEQATTPTAGDAPLSPEDEAFWRQVGAERHDLDDIGISSNLVGFVPTGKPGAASDAAESLEATEPGLPPPPAPPAHVDFIGSGLDFLDENNSSAVEPPPEPSASAQTTESSWDAFEPEPTQADDTAQPAEDQAPELEAVADFELVVPPAPANAPPVVSAPVPESPGKKSIWSRFFGGRSKSQEPVAAPPIAPPPLAPEPRDLISHTPPAEEPPALEAHEELDWTRESADAFDASESSDLTPTEEAAAQVADEATESEPAPEETAWVPDSTDAPSLEIVPTSEGPVEEAPAIDEDHDEFALEHAVPDDFAIEDVLPEAAAPAASAVEGSSDAWTPPIELLNDSPGEGESTVSAESFESAASDDSNADASLNPTWATPQSADDAAATSDPEADAPLEQSAIVEQPGQPFIGTAEMTLGGMGGQGGQIMLTGGGPIGPMWGGADASSPLNAPDQAIDRSADQYPNQAEADTIEETSAVDTDTDADTDADAGTVESFESFEATDEASDDESTAAEPSAQQELPPDFFDDLTADLSSETPEFESLESQASETAAGETTEYAGEAPPSPEAMASTASMEEQPTADEPAQTIAGGEMTLPEPAPAVDPFFGMGRDQGSFFGGMPLNLGPVPPPGARPVAASKEAAEAMRSYQSPPPAPAFSELPDPMQARSPSPGAALARPRLPFGDAPVTFDTKVDTLAELIAVENNDLPLFGAPPIGGPSAPLMPMRSDLFPNDNNEEGHSFAPGYGTMTDPAADAPTLKEAESEEPAPEQSSADDAAEQRSIAEAPPAEEPPADEPPATDLESGWEDAQSTTSGSPADQALPLQPADETPATDELIALEESAPDYADEAGALPPSATTVAGQIEPTLDDTLGTSTVYGDLNAEADGAAVSDPQTPTEQEAQDTAAATEYFDFESAFNEQTAESSSPVETPAVDEWREQGQSEETVSPEHAAQAEPEPSAAPADAASSELDLDEVLSELEPMASDEAGLANETPAIDSAAAFPEDAGVLEQDPLEAAAGELSQLIPTRRPRQQAKRPRSTSARTKGRLALMTPCLIRRSSTKPLAKSPRPWRTNLCRRSPSRSWSRRSNRR